MNLSIQFFRRSFCLGFCVLACVLNGRSEINISFHIPGVHFEHHSASSRSVPVKSFALNIETNGQNLSGTWSASLSNSKLDKYSTIWVPIEVSEGNFHHHSGISVGASSPFAFLFADKKQWPGQATIVMPSGSLLLTGKASGKTLKGDFTFSPETNYIARVTKELQEQPSALELLYLGLQDVTLKQISAYTKTGLKFRVGDILRMKNSGISPEQCIEMRKVREFSIDEIVRLHNSGVSPEFVAGLKSAGYNFDAGDIVRLRNSGVSAEFARAWKQAGFDYDAESLVRMRNSGVPADFAKAIREAFPNASREQIVRLRNSGLSAEFIRDMKNADATFDAETYIRLRNAGVTPDFVRAWRAAGYNYSADEIVRLRNAGVPAEYAAAIRIADRKPLQSETLIRLRNQGISAEEIRELRE